MIDLPASTTLAEFLQMHVPVYKEYVRDTLRLDIEEDDEEEGYEYSLLTCEQQLAQSRVELAEAKEFTLQEAEAAVAQAYAEQVIWYANRRDRTIAALRNLMRLTITLKAWAPPSPAHEGFKVYLLDLLRSERTDQFRVYNSTPPVRADAQTYRDRRVKEAERYVAMWEQRVALHAQGPVTPAWRAQLEEALSTMKEERASMPGVVFVPSAEVLVQACSDMFKE